MANKKHKFYVLNVKLQSHKEGEERVKAYENLIRRLTEKPRYTRLNKNDAIIMYPPFEREEKGTKFFYGNIGKGISFFDKEEIRVLNNNNISKETWDKDKILEPLMGQFIFIPSIHRFGLLKTPKSISVKEFEAYLRDQLPKFIESDEKIEINFEKEPSIIEEIFNAQAVYRLSYEISYSNNDALKAQGEHFDNLLKENRIGKLNLTAQSDHNPEGMNINDVEFLGGGLEVARNNGVIKSATIKTANKPRPINVSNQERPLVHELQIINENEIFPLKWFLKLFNLYKK